MTPEAAVVDPHFRLRTSEPRRRREFHRNRNLESVVAVMLLDFSIEGLANLTLHIGGLTLDERRGPHGARQQALPQFVWRRHGIRERDRLDLDVPETFVNEQSSELLLIREPKERRSDRDLLWRLGSRFSDRIEKHPEKTSPFRNIPYRERQAPTRDQDPKELRCGSLRPGEMEHHEIPDDRVKRVVGKREGLGISDAEPELRMEARSKCHHRIGDVHANDRSASLRPPGSRITWTRCNIKHPQAIASFDGVEQWLDEKSRDSTEELVVAGGLPVPSRRLERRERIFVDRRLRSGLRSYDVLGWPTTTPGSSGTIGHSALIRRWLESYPAQEVVRAERVSCGRD
jgi:hypothetical protein